ncbi:MAG: flagellar basal body-associated FliL family protein [Sphingomonadaceae bacterium]|nr:flagellar basal body-associated FliL family protein [Sphingomonadaceae bacterium]
MTPINEAIGPEDLAALEAALPRKWWSGRRIVTAALIALAFAAALYGLQWAAAPGVLTPAAPHYVEVPEMTVNLRAKGGERRYLKVRVVIEAASREDAAAISARLPAVIDGFQSFLRELRPQDLGGASGTYRIKEELMVRINRAGPGRASDVLVQELIQQ